MAVFSFNSFLVADVYDYYGSTITAKKATQVNAIMKSIADNVMSCDDNKFPVFHFCSQLFLS